MILRWLEPRVGRCSGQAWTSNSRWDIRLGFFVFRQQADENKRTYLFYRAMNQGRTDICIEYRQQISSEFRTSNPLFTYNQMCLITFRTRDPSIPSPALGIGTDTRVEYSTHQICADTTTTLILVVYVCIRTFCQICVCNCSESLWQWPHVARWSNYTTTLSVLLSTDMHVNMYAVFPESFQ